MPDLQEKPNRPPRAALYSEVVALSVKLRWVVVVAGAVWLSAARPGPTAAWLVGWTAAYSIVLTLVYRVGRHPPMWVASVLDVTAITAFLILFGSPRSPAPLTFILIIVVLVLAYGWRGVLLSLGAYVIGEVAVFLTEPARAPDTTALLLRATLLGFVALVLGAVVARYEDARARLARVAIHDRVTGLFNRQYFAQALEQVHKLATRTGSPYSVVVVEASGMDDSTVAALGDEDTTAVGRELRMMANEIRSSLRSTDMVARTGEREFSIVLPETALPAAASVARKVMERMRSVDERAELLAGVADLRPTRRSAFEDALHAAYGAMARARTGDAGDVVTVSVDSGTGGGDR